MSEKSYFQYDQDAINHLKQRDARLAQEIERIGKIEREIIPDLFPALIYCIVGQQISNRAAATVWMRMLDRFGEISPHMISLRTAEEIQKCGLTMRKAGTSKILLWRSSRETCIWSNFTRFRMRKSSKFWLPYRALERGLQK